MNAWKAPGTHVNTVLFPMVLGASGHGGRPADPTASELFITHTGWLPSVHLPPWEEPGRLQAELRNQISQASAFPSSPLAKESSSRPHTNSCLVLKGQK